MCFSHCYFFFYFVPTNNVLVESTTTRPISAESELCPPKDHHWQLSWWQNSRLLVLQDNGYDYGKLDQETPLPLRMFSKWLDRQVQSLPARMTRQTTTLILAGCKPDTTGWPNRNPPVPSTLQFNWSKKIAQKSFHVKNKWIFVLLLP